MTRRIRRLPWLAPSFAAGKGAVHGPAANPAMTPETRAAKLMTVLPMVLTPLLLEKPNFTKETKQFASSCRVRRSVSETEGRPGCPGTFCRLERIRMLVMTPGRSKGGSAIARSRAQRSTRPWRRTGLRISGESELEGARQRPGNLADSFALRMALSPLDREHGVYTALAPRANTRIEAHTYRARISPPD